MVVLNTLPLRFMVAVFSLASIKGLYYVPKWSCDFERGLCDWYQVDVDGFGWTHSDDEPWKVRDHTTNSPDGSYAVLDLSGWRFGIAGKLVSPLFRPTNGSCKMVFYSRLERRLSYTNIHLTVEKVTRKSNQTHHEVLFAKNKEHNRWEKGEIVLNSSANFQLEFVGNANYAFGKILLDDIMFTEGCFTDESTPIKVVRLWLLPKYNFPQGVFYEKSGNHWSMVCRATEALKACRYLGFSDIAKSNSLVNGFRSGQSICLSKNITLSNSISCRNKSDCVQGRYWRCDQIYIKTCPRLTHKTCTGTTGDPECYTIHQRCDFVKDCPSGEDEEGCDENRRCNFQAHFCNWIPSKHTALEWQRVRGVDDNYYLEVKNSYSLHKHDMAKLLLNTTIEGSPSVKCYFRFSYKLPRYWKGVLRIVLILRNTTEVVWSRVYARRATWFRENVFLSSLGTFKVRVDAIDDSDSLGYFRLANISFSPECIFKNHPNGQGNSSERFTCHSGEQISRLRLCNLKADCFDGSDEFDCKPRKETCTFDRSFCNWRVEDEAVGRLLRHRGRTSTTGTGPRRDHTNKFISGYYVYLEASNLRSGESGHLVSELMQRPVSRKCTFRWFYHMYRWYYFTMGTLSVIYYDPVSRKEKVLWTRSNSQGDIWKYGSVTFDVDSLFYRIKFKFKRGYSHEGDIAVDDVSFSEDCYNTTRYTPLSVMQVHCSHVIMYRQENHKASIFYEYNRTHGTSLNCRWLITADPRLRIHLSSEYFYTDSSYSWLTVDDINRGERLAGPYSGAVAPFNLITSSNEVQIHFSTTHMKNNQGFVLNLSSTDAPASRVELYRPPSGRGDIQLYLDCKGGPTTSWSYSHRAVIFPRGYSRGGYFNDEDCVYKLLASNGNRMRLSFAFFNTERGHDYVQVLNEGVIGNGLFTGNLDPFYFVSKNSLLSFRFKTDDRVTKRGFIVIAKVTNEPARGATVSNISTSAIPTRTPISVPFNFLDQRCSVSRRQLWIGDKYTGFLQPDHLLHSASCIWKTPAVTEFQYVIEVNHRYLDHVITSLQITDNRDSHSRTLTSLEQIRQSQNPMVVSEGAFAVSSSLEDTRFNQTLMSYSIYPACYSASYGSGYTVFYIQGRSAKDCIEYCATAGYKYAFIIWRTSACNCERVEPSRKNLRMLHPRFCFDPPSFKHCSTGICLSGRFGVLYLTDLGVPSQMAKAKSASVTSWTVVVIIASVLALVILVAIVIKCKMGKCRVVAHQQPESAIPGGALSVSYAPDPIHREAPPSYEDATKEGTTIFPAGYATAAFPSPRDPPPPFEYTVDDVARRYTPPPKYEDIAYASSQAPEDGCLAATPAFMDRSQYDVELPTIENVNLRPAQERSRPASTGSVDSNTDSGHPLMQSTSREQRNPRRMLPPLQIRVRAMDNRDSGSNS